MPSQEELERAEQRRREAAKLRGENWTITKIARHLGVSKQCVSKYLYEMGIKTKPPKDRYAMDYDPRAFRKQNVETAYFAGGMQGRAGFKLVLNPKSGDEMGVRLMFRRSRNDRGEFESMRQFLQMPDTKTDVLTLRWRDQLQQDLERWGVNENSRQEGRLPQWLKETALEEHYWRGWFEFSVPTFSNQGHLVVTGAIPMVMDFIDYVQRETGLELSRGPVQGIKRACIRISALRMPIVATALYRSKKGPRIAEIEEGMRNKK